MPKTYNYDWQALLDEQEASGMNMKHFCREKSLPYQTFKIHKYKLQNQPIEQKQFIPVKTSVPQVVQFNLNGNTLCFDSSLDDATISRIVKAVIS